MYHNYSRLLLETNPLFSPELFISQWEEGELNRCMIYSATDIKINKILKRSVALSSTGI